MTPIRPRTISHSFYRAISVLFFGTFLLYSCSNSHRDRILVQGRIDGVTEIVYLLEQTTSELIKIDSTVPDDHGIFSISTKADETGIYALRITTDHQVVFIAAPGDTLLITGNLNAFPSNIQVSGNEESELLHTFYLYSAKNLREVDSIQRVIERSQGEEDFYELTLKADSSFNQIWERQKRYEIEFINENAGNFAILLVVNYHFGVKPVLSPKEDPESYRRVDSALMAGFPGNRHTFFFHQWLKEVK